MRAPRAADVEAVLAYWFESERDLPHAMTRCVTDAPVGSENYERLFALYAVHAQTIGAALRALGAARAGDLPADHDSAKLGQ